MIETDSERKSVLDRFKKVFPEFSTKKFAVIKGTGKIVAIGKKGGEYKIMKDDWTDFTKNFLDSFKDELGPSAGDIIAEDRDTIREQRQRLIESENQLKQTEDIIAKRKQEELEVKDLQQKIGKSMHVLMLFNLIMAPILKMKQKSAD